MTKDERRRLGALMAAIKQTIKECEQFYEDFSLLTAKSWAEDLRDAIKEFNSKGK